MRKPRFSKYKVVSFDIFDTLVSRLVCNPHDVFKLVEARSGMAGFAAARAAAERSARTKGKPEVTFEEIYAELQAPFSQKGALEALMACELEVEMDVCVANTAGRRLYEDARESGARVVITSDMYLPESFLKRVLLACGYSGWDRLFVSCEHNATKATGALYDVVLEEMGVGAANTLHVGDNPKSDILRARMRGLSALRMRPPRLRAESLTESFVLAAQSARSGTPVGSEPYIEDFGYRCLGPLLVGFCEWLAAELSNEGIDKVFYLARDGLVIQRTMAALGVRELAGTYLYASRRALQVPSIALLESFEAIVHSMFLPKSVSLRKLFRKMGLDEDAVARRLVEERIDPDCQRSSQGLVCDGEALRAYRILESDIKRNAAEELDLLVSYLKQNDFTGKVAIVDIGWFGNMQLALERVCSCTEIDAEIHGYYVGLAPEGRNQLSHNMKGYLFDASHGKSNFEREHFYNLIFETLFSATHGTTRGYRREASGNVVPALAEYSGCEEAIGRRAERAREGALQFAGDWRRVVGTAGSGIDPELAQRAMSKVGVEPTLDESRCFGKWAMESDGELAYAANPQKTIHYLAHPAQLARDYALASWKVGFLKQLLKAPLPYGRVLIRLRRLAKRLPSSAPSRP